MPYNVIVMGPSPVTEFVLAHRQYLSRTRFSSWQRSTIKMSERRKGGTLRQIPLTALIWREIFLLHFIYFMLRFAVTPFKIFVYLTGSIEDTWRTFLVTIRNI